MRFLFFACIACAALAGCTEPATSSAPGFAVNVPPVSVTGPDGSTATVSNAGATVTGPTMPLHVGSVTITPSAPVTVTVTAPTAAAP